MEENIPIIGEENEVHFKSYRELSYREHAPNDPYVHLYKNDKLIGKIKVWKDVEMKNREYICVNYEVLYLNTMTRRLKP